VDIAEALAHLSGQRSSGPLVTLRPDGSPHAAIVSAVVMGDALWVSSTQSRRKTSNIRHDPRVTYITGTGPWVAIDGTATILDDAEETPERLRVYYRAAAGEHPDWAEYDEAMIQEQRLIIQITPTRAYGFI
jgi:PPOX class probable F420-dependent enzyme